MTNIFKTAALVFLTLVCAGIVYSQPVANNDTIGVCNNDSVHIMVLSNDVGDGLVLDDILVEPEGGDANEVDDLYIRYKPDEDFIGTDALVYAVEDADELFDIATVIIYVQDSLTCVWPGDANNDKIANNRDILNIGLYYGNVGPERFETDLDWDNDYCDDWSEELDILSLAPQKFSDCNGDGLVDANDTLPILVNYGEEHDKGDDIMGGDDIPPLFIDFFSDTIYAGASVALPLILGTIDYPASNVYGLAFTIGGGDGIIVPGSLRVTFGSGWLGEPGADLISLNYYDSTSASYDVGVSRITHTSAGGYGNIGTVEFVMEDDLAGKTDDIAVQLMLCVGGLTALNDFGNPIEIGPQCDSVIVYKIETGIETTESSGIKIFPNPANESSTIYFPQNTSGHVIVKNITGSTKEVIDITNTDQITLNSNHYHPGTYILEIQTGTIVQYQKLIVQH
ncbi:MAG: Ig-like domain-containing protein [Chitinophagales bacterium]